MEDKYGKAPLNRKRAREDDEDDDDESSSEDEDEVGDLATEALDQEIMATLNAIRNKDPRIYEKDATFYTQNPDGTTTMTNVKKEEKPVFLRDYHRMNLLSGNGVVDEDDETEGKKTFVQEQEHLKQSVVKEMHDKAGDVNEDDDEFLVRKPKAERDAVPDDLPDPSTADPNNPDEYLTKFLSSRAWVKNTGYPALESDDTEDEERASQLEHDYNMRFEDPDAAARSKLVSYGRDAVSANTVRREEKSRRKRAREEKRSRKEEEKAQRAAEKSRLKKLKTEELMEKYRQIRDAAGLEGADEEAEVLEKLLEGDFTDEQWDEWMKERFNEDYYASKDGLKKPEFSDDIDIGDIDPNFVDETIREDEDEEEDGEEGGVDIEMPEVPEAGSEEEEEADPAPRKKKKDIIKEKQQKKQREKVVRRKLERFVEDDMDLDVEV